MPSNNNTDNNTVTIAATSTTTASATTTTTDDSSVKRLNSAFWQSTYCAVNCLEQASLCVNGAQHSSCIAQFRFLVPDNCLSALPLFDPCDGATCGVMVSTSAFLACH